MATEVSKLANMIDPEVLGDMVSATLDSAIKFQPFAHIDDSLVGVPGSTITMPAWSYIGDAVDVAEGGSVEGTLLKATSTTATVTKVAKSVHLTDEAVLSAYGDPIGEAATLIAKAIASKVDADCAAVLSAAETVYNGSTDVISYEAIVNAVDLFGEEDQQPKVMFIHPKQVTQLRLDADFRDINRYPIPVVMSGVIGEIAGCQIVPSNRVKLTSGNYLCPIVKLSSEETDTDPRAFTIIRKRDTLVESARDIKGFVTTIVGSMHYAVAITNPKKVVVAKLKSVPPTPTPDPTPGT